MTTRNLGLLAAMASMLAFSAQAQQGTMDHAAPVKSGQTTGGQTAGAPAAVAAPVALSAILDAYVSDFEHSMMNVAKAMPEDKYNFAPSAAIFAPGSPAKFDGVMAFGPMVIHVAQGIYGSYASASGLKPDVDTKALANLKTKAEIVAALQGSFDFAHKATAMLTPENTMVGTRPNRTKLGTAITGIAHSQDHYGQLVEYLRMNGIVPPGSAGAEPVAK